MTPEVKNLKREVEALRQHFKQSIANAIKDSIKCQKATGQEKCNTKSKSAIMNGPSGKQLKPSYAGTRSRSVSFYRRKNIKSNIPEESSRSPHIPTTRALRQRTTHKQNSKTLPRRVARINRSCSFQYHNKNSIPKKAKVLYSCSVEGCAGLRFSNVAQKNKHLLTHRLKNPNSLMFSCTMCPKEFKTLGGLSIHQSHHTFTRTDVRCFICDVTFESTNVLKKHYEDVHPEEEMHEESLRVVHCNSKKESRKRVIYKCESCPKIFHHVHVFQKHVRANHPQKVKQPCYKCPHPDCKREFETNHGLTIHLNFHNDVFTYKCSFCSLDCPSSTELRIHQIDKHEKEAREHGFFSSSSSYDILRSLKKVSRKRTIYKCTVPGCLEIFRNIFLYKSHIINSGHSQDLEEGLLTKGSDTNTTTSSIRTIGIYKHKCNKCNKELLSDKGYKRHIQKYCKGKPKDRAQAWCSKCKLNYYEIDLLEKHFKKYHENDETEVYEGEKGKTKENTVQCYLPNCNTKFADLYKLDMHLTTHHDVPAKCWNCEKSFENARLLLRHQEVHTKERYKCSKADCQAQFKSFAPYVAHERKHNEMLPYTCPMCEESFLTKTQMRRHRVAEHNLTVTQQRQQPPPSQNKQFCDICLEYFRDGYILKNHKIRMHGERKIPCDICKFMFATQADLRKHRKEKHKNSDSLICEICGQNFSTKECLRTHGSLHLPEEEKPFKCDYKDCAKTFNQRVSYLDHCRIHTGETPYKCTNCGQAWRTSMALNLHVKSKLCLDKKERICEICGKRFRNQHFLDLHTGRAHGDTVKVFNHNCDLCGKGFAKRAAMLEHRYIHTNEKPYECLYCGATFRHRSGLYQHSKMRHKNIKPSYRINAANQVSAGRNVWKKGRPRKYQQQNPDAVQQTIDLASSTDVSVVAPIENTSAPLALIAPQTELPVAELNSFIGDIGGDCSDQTVIHKIDLIFPTGDNIGDHSHADGAFLEFSFDLQDINDTVLEVNCVENKTDVNFLAAMGIKSEFIANYNDETEWNGSRLIDNVTESQPSPIEIVGNEEEVESENITSKGTMEILPGHCIKQLRVKLERLDVFSCKTCNMSFPTKPRYRSHCYSARHLQQKHKPPLPRENNRAETGDMIDDLYEENWKSKEIQCGICDKVFNSEKSFGKHVRTHENAAKRECRLCSRPFKVLRELLDHFESEHKGERPFKCDKCSRAFRVPSNLNEHVAKVHERKDRLNIVQKSFNCRICSEAFSVLRTMLLHCASVHPGQKPFRCDLCGVEISRPHHFKRHHLEVHGPASRPKKKITDEELDENGEKRRRPNSQMKEKVACEPCICATCGKSLKSPRMLRVHMNLHTRDKDQLCDLCGKAFRQKYDLEVHRRIHTGEKPFMCNECPRSFYSAGDKKKHVDRAHRFIIKPRYPKNHHCPTCPDRFRSEKALENHMGVHDPNRPFHCHLCTHRFNFRGNLTTHIKLVHTNKEVKSCGQGEESELQSTINSDIILETFLQLN